MPYTVSQYGAEEKTRFLNGLKSMLDVLQVFDPGDGVVVAGNTLTAKKNNVTRFVVDANNWITYQSLLASGSVAGQISFDSYSWSFLGLCAETVLITHDSGTGGLFIGTDTDGEFFIAMFTASNGMATVCEDSTIAYSDPYYRVASNGAWSSVVPVLTYGSTVTPKKAVNVYRFVDRQTNVPVGSIYPIKIDGIDFLTDGYIAATV